MKRIHNTVEPEFAGKAKLIDYTGHELEVPCKIWLPRHIYENTYIEFDCAQNIYGSCVNPRNTYQFKMEQSSPDGKAYREITVENLYIENHIQSSSNTEEFPSIFFDSEPDCLVIKQTTYPEQFSGEISITFSLGENLLLEPYKQIEPSYTGEIKVKHEACHEDEINGVGKIKFDRHFYYLDNDNAAITQCSHLVALVSMPPDFKNSTENVGGIKKKVEDYLLLSSYAGNQSTRIAGYSVVDNKLYTRAFYGNLTSYKNNITKKQNHSCLLIPKAQYEEFILSASRTFNNYEDDKRALLRQVIHKVIPVFEEVVETRILNLFSALEAIVLIYRREKNFEFTVSSGEKWKRLESDLKKVIKDHDAFPTEEHRQMLIRMVPSLKRVSLKDAYNSLIKERPIDTEDLWPVFKEPNGFSLNDIRNKLSHGDSFEKELMAPLCHAMKNLEVLVNRLLMSYLGWDSNKSNISKNYLEQSGWISYKSIENDMIKTITPEE